MKTKAILSLVSLALFAAVGQSFARGGGGGGGGFGGGGHFGGGGFGGGHFGGGGGFGGGHFGGGGGFGGGHFGGGGFHGSGFNGGGHVVTGVGTRGGGVGFGGMRSRNGVPNFEGTGPRFSSFGHPSHAQPEPNASRAQASRGLVARQPDQRVSNIRNHIVARHDANWHSDWDRRHAHFDHGRFFVFSDGFWYGLDSGFFPWDYFPYYAYDYYPYDYYPGYYDDVEPYYDYEGVADYVPTPDPNVVAVQKDLANLGYYHGSIDGIYGRNTRDAVGRYQTDHNQSVTGTLTTQTLQALGVSQSTPSGGSTQ